MLALQQINRYLVKALENIIKEARQNAQTLEARGMGRPAISAGGLVGPLITAEAAVLSFLVGLLKKA